MQKTRLRRFVCASCGHEFEMLYGTGQSGKQTKCPVCGGMVCRTDLDSTSSASGSLAKKSRSAGRGWGRRIRGGVTL